MPDKVKPVEMKFETPKVEEKKIETRWYKVNVDRGLMYDRLTRRVMDLRGETGPPFEHIPVYRMVEAEPASAEKLVKKGFLTPVGEKRTDERSNTEK